jgi:hypothetical protein
MNNASHINRYRHGTWYSGGERHARKLVYTLHCLGQKSLTRKVELRLPCVRIPQELPSQASAAMRLLLMRVRSRACACVCVCVYISMKILHT